MLRIKRLCAVLTVTIGSLGFVAQEAKAQATDAQAAPGVNFTKIQDLDPNAKATNKLIKQKWAVVIGAGNFKENRLNGFFAMDKAAYDFYDYLVDPKAGRFDKTHVKLLVNSAATRQNVMNNLGSGWLGKLAGPDDIVVVFISTHGFPTTDGSTYLCAYDCALDNVYSTCLSMQDLMQTLKSQVKSDRILLVLQACYSGAAELTAGSKALFNGYNVDLNKVVLGKGYVILTSSKADQMTWGDSFSRSLTKALREKDGMVPLRDAFEKAKQDTEHATTYNQPRGKTQTPVMKADWKGNDLVLGAPTEEKVSEIPSEVATAQAAEAYYLKANNFVVAGQLNEAVPQYELAIKTDPFYADALGDYGVLLSIKGDLEGARDKLKRAIAARPSDVLFHANYARVLDRLGDEPGCMNELAQAYKLNNKDRIVLTALAAKAIKANDGPRAKAFLEQAVSLYPNSADLHQRLSFVLSKSGDVEGAMAHAKEAAHIDPKNVTARLNLASTMKMSGDVQGAISTYREAVKIAPENADAHYLLSQALAEFGQADEAKEEFGKFKSLCSPSDPRINGN